MNQEARKITSTAKIQQKENISAECIAWSHIEPIFILILDSCFLALLLTY
jgi:hypothetical protein